VYYRVYTVDGAILSKSAFDPGDPFIGRIAARSVPPPHTATSLKRRLANAENLSDEAGLTATLFLNPCAQTAMLPTDNVAILNGTTSETPFTLVLSEEPPMERNNTAAPVVKNKVDNQRYLYYRLYTQVNEDPSTAAFNTADPALGRIEVLHVCPPYEAGSIKRCIAKAEGKSIYAVADLYSNIASSEAIENGSQIVLLEDGSMGSSPDSPIILVRPGEWEGFWRKVFKKVKHPSPVSGSYISLFLLVRAVKPRLRVTE
ncbi:hypothetical protein DFH07DRAFT_747376, partial [Mycena maculata]